LQIYQSLGLAAEVERLLPLLIAVAERNGKTDEAAAYRLLLGKGKGKP
jgi:hypothetical protein